ncbi:hypothetical protein [Burkholderia pyrrocinia]|uniref:hypothetical protein n=1 Tax=Burkholderia pyrrocinia TaxID=60550 RepID=UPI0015889600|nr:hypothetical protein [Burkholderia pyrrocinia]
MRLRINSILLVWLLMLVGNISAAYADDLTRSVTTRDLSIHYGVVPTSQASAPTRSSPQAIHNVNLYVLTVALFDKSTGKRIEDAHVVAVVRGPRSEASRVHSKAVTMQLDPVREGGAITYGNVFDARWKGTYHIELSITQNGETHPEHVLLNYEQQF